LELQRRAKAIKEDVWLLGSQSHSGTKKSGVLVLLQNWASNNPAMELWF